MNIDEKPAKFIRRREVEKRIGRSHTWIYEQLANPSSDFPRPIRPNPSTRNIVWVESEVEAWMQKRIEPRLPKFGHQRNARLEQQEMNSCVNALLPPLRDVSEHTEQVTYWRCIAFPEVCSKKHISREKAKTCSEAALIQRYEEKRALRVKCVTLRLQGVSTKEVARIVGCTPSIVASSVKFALSLFRWHFSDENQEDTTHEALKKGLLILACMPSHKWFAHKVGGA